MKHGHTPTPIELPPTDILRSCSPISSDPSRPPPQLGLVLLRPEIREPWLLR